MAGKRLDSLPALVFIPGIFQLCAAGLSHVPEFVWEMCEL